MRGGSIGSSCGAHLGDVETPAAINLTHRLQCPFIDCPDTCTVVSFRGRQQDRQARTRTHGASDTGHRCGLRMHQTAEQRTSWEVCGQQICRLIQLRWQCLGGGDYEQRIGQTASTGPCSGSSGRLCHRCGVSVDTNDELTRVSCCGGQHVLAITGSQVDRRCGVLGEEFPNLAEADVLHTSAGNYAHLELPIVLGLASSLCVNNPAFKFISSVST
jgi:hypothetical protein